MAEDLENKDNILPAIPAAISDFLPYKDMNGDLVHVVYINKKFYVSKEFFDRLLLEPSSILEKLNKYAQT